jgi:malate synthase
MKILQYFARATWLQGSGCTEFNNLGLVEDAELKYAPLKSDLALF